MSRDGGRLREAWMTADNASLVASCAMGGTSIWTMTMAFGVANLTSGAWKRCPRASERARVGGDRL